MPEWEDSHLLGTMLVQLETNLYAFAAQYRDGSGSCLIQRDGENVLALEGLAGLDAAATAVEEWLEQHHPQGALWRPHLSQTRLYAPFYDRA